MSYCLEAGGITAADLDYVVFYEKPFVKFERLIETYVTFAPRGFPSFLKAMPLWLKEKLFLKKLLRDSLKEIDPKTEWAAKLLFAEHHQSHAASAFYPSPFEEALILTMDGVGEWCTTSAAIGRGDTIEIQKEIRFPHSLGLLYSAFTYYTGFKVNSGEYKVMGLAPYGAPRFAQTILDNLIDVRDDGSFALNLDYFDYCTGLTMTNRRFDALFGGPARKTGPAARPAAYGPRGLDPGGHRARRIAPCHRSRTRVRTAKALPCRRRGAQLRGQRQAPAPGSVRRHLGATGRRRCWRRTRGGPRGQSYASQRTRRMRNRPDAMDGSYLGPAYKAHEIETALTAAGARFDKRDDRTIDPRDGGGARGGKGAWDGSRDAWSLGRGRSATGRSSAIRARPPCRSFSI